MFIQHTAQCALNILCNVHLTYGTMCIQHAVQCAVNMQYSVQCAFNMLAIATVFFSNIEVNAVYR